MLASLHGHATHHMLVSMFPLSSSTLLPISSSSYLTAETDPAPKEMPFLCTWTLFPSLPPTLVFHLFAPCDQGEAKRKK